MPSRKSAVIAGVSCLSLVIVTAVTALVLRQKGYLAFNDPCVAVESFRIVDFEMGVPRPAEEDEDDEESSSSSILDVLDSFTGGLASELVEVIPTQATVTIGMVLEFNNTNPYDLECEQEEEGLIELIPAGADYVDYWEGEGEDLALGTWSVVDTTLKGNARSEIPVEVVATIDLKSDDAIDLGADLVAGRPVAFRVTGGMVGFIAWAPDFEARISLTCLVRVDDVFDPDGERSVRCRHSVRVGELVRNSGEVDFVQNAASATGEYKEVDSACLV